MAVSFDSVMLQAMPMVKTILMLILGLGSIIGVGYYLFVVKRRREWIINLWEKKADGRLHLIGKDKLQEKKFNKGKQIAYILKQQRIETFPPPWESTYRVRNKEYADYLRIREDDFQPMNKKPSFKMEHEDNPLEKARFFANVRNRIHDIKNSLKKDIEDKYIAIPVDNTLSCNMEFEVMDYDINMMRINAIDNRDKIYADKQTWLQQYGTFLALGMIVVLIIVVLYLSYDYSSNVLNMSYGKATETLKMVEQLAGKIGGVAPAS